MVEYSCEYLASLEEFVCELVMEREEDSAIITNKKFHLAQVSQDTSFLLEEGRGRARLARRSPSLGHVRRAMRRGA